MKKTFAILLALFCTFSLLYSQQQPLSTHSKKAAKLYEEAANYMMRKTIPLPLSS
jgi:uncharacterized protein (DUF486 family)